MNRFRIEERDADTGVVLIATDQGWDGPLTETEAQGRFARELREHPGRYALGSPYRLVLVDTTRPSAPVADLGDVASGRVPLPPSGGAR
jgi:hypothetical protein